MTVKSGNKKKRLPQRRKQSVDLLPGEHRKLVALRSRVEQAAIKRVDCDVPIHLGEVLRVGVVVLGGVDTNEILEMVINLRKSK